MIECRSSRSRNWCKLTDNSKLCKSLPSHNCYLLFKQKLQVWRTSKLYIGSVWGTASSSRTKSDLGDPKTQSHWVLQVFSWSSWSPAKLLQPPDIEAGCWQHCLLHQGWRYIVGYHQHTEATSPLVMNNLASTKTSIHFIPVLPTTHPSYHMCFWNFLKSRFIFYHRQGNKNRS